MKKCPICKGKLKVRNYSDAEMVEYYLTCEDGCKNYNYEEWCGEYRMDIGSTVLAWNYREKKSQSNKRLFIQKRKISRIRKAYKKGKL